MCSIWCGLCGSHRKDIRVPAELKVMEALFIDDFQANTKGLNTNDAGYFRDMAEDYQVALSQKIFRDYKRNPVPFRVPRKQLSEVEDKFKRLVARKSDWQIKIRPVVGKDKLYFDNGCAKNNLSKVTQSVTQKRTSVIPVTNKKEVVTQETLFESKEPQKKDEKSYTPMEAVDAIQKVVGSTKFRDKNEREFVLSYLSNRLV